MLEARLLAIVLPLVTVCSISAQAQTVRSSAPARPDSGVHVITIDSNIKLVTHGDTAMWVWQRPTGRIDSVTYIMRGDSAWRIKPGPKQLIDASQVKMMRNVLKANRTSARLDSLYGGARPP